MKNVTAIALAAFLTACGSHTYTLSSHSGWSGVAPSNVVVLNGGGPGFNQPPAVVPTPVVTPTPVIPSIPPEVKPPVVTPPVVVPPVVPSNDHHHQHEHHHDKQHHQHDKEHEHHDAHKH